MLLLLVRKKKSVLVDIAPFLFPDFETHVTFFLSFPLFI